MLVLALALANNEKRRSESTTRNTKNTRTNQTNHTEQTINRQTRLRPLLKSPQITWNRQQTIADVSDYLERTTDDCLNCRRGRPRLVDYTANGRHVGNGGGGQTVHAECLPHPLHAMPQTTPSTSLHCWVSARLCPCFTHTRSTRLESPPDRTASQASTAVQHPHYERAHP